MFEFKTKEETLAYEKALKEQGVLQLNNIGQIS
jgi:hypothetical protein